MDKSKLKYRLAIFLGIPLILAAVILLPLLLSKDGFDLVRKFVSPDESSTIQLEGRSPFLFLGEHKI